MASRHSSGPALKSIQALLSTGTLSGLTDHELLERFTTSDTDTAELAFTALVHRHGSMVLRVCRSILRDDHAADDAFQATFLILALKAHSIRGRDRFSSWLYSVAYNVAATARSSAARRRQHEQRAGEQRATTLTESPVDDLSSIIHQELSKLPDRERTVLILCYLESQTLQQAAHRLGLPLGTVQSRLSRGRARLRNRLIRRGLAPTIALEALFVGSASTQAAVPIVLSNATVRLGVTMGASRLLVIGGAPLTVISLARGVVRTMYMTKALKSIAAALLFTASVGVTGAAVEAYQSARPDSAVLPPKPNQTPNDQQLPKSDIGELTVTGIVRMPDKSPVPGVTVMLMPERYEPPRSTITDAAGRFEFQGIFGNGCRLHAASVDSMLQGVVSLTATEARTALTTRISLTLFPTLNHQVTVLSEGRPVAGAHVLTMGPDFRISGKTGQDGKAKLKLPAKATLNEVVAWHPTQGIAGIQNLGDRSREAATQLSLYAPAAHTIRVLDSEGKPVSGLGLCVSAKPLNADWITSYVEASHVRTDSSGTVIVPWLPRQELERVDVEPTLPDWKVDETNSKEFKKHISTVYMRREQTVHGRLIMPNGASAEGILISGFGFGPLNLGDRPSARARRDGTFTIRVPSEHAFVLGVSDDHWASDLWSGTILGKGATKPSDISIKVYPATGLVVRVTRGPQSDPLAKASVNLQSEGSVSWTDRAGKKQNGIAGPGAYINTDGQGIARAGVGKGRHRLTLIDGPWIEERIVEVKDDKPIEVHFHRAWKGDQKIQGRMTLDGEPHTPSGSLLSRVWAPRTQGWGPSTFEPTISPNGTFDVAFDAGSVSLLFWDRDKKCSAFLASVKGGAQCEVAMEPTASYSGRLVDEDGRPVAGRTVDLQLVTGSLKPIASESTDADGRFHFSSVPANTPLQIRHEPEVEEPECYISNGSLFFKPGELREKHTLILHVSAK